jgi:hypothetical protein
MQLIFCASNNSVSQLQQWMLTEDVFAACTSWAEAHASAIDLSTEDNLLCYTTLHKEFEAWIDSKLEV